jgi:hypothetical protein
MDLISPQDVIKAIEGYFGGGALRYLRETEAAAADRAIEASQANTYELDSLNRYDAPLAIRRAIDRLPLYPGNFHGRGIVICGGGLRYFPCAWVCIKMLRHVGCQLPVQFWYQGSEEMDRNMISLIESLGVECVDARLI